MSLAHLCARLARTPGLTAEHVQTLARAAGDPAHLCAPEVIARVSLPAPARTFLAAPAPPAVCADVQWCESNGAQLVLCLDTAYPPQLAATPGAPPVLYVQGDVAALRRPQLAVVGSRRPTPAGRRIGHEFAAALAGAGLVITSGMALGIDTAGHEGALEAGGTTIAVFGCGLAHRYPRENSALAERILRRGALVSEFPPWEAPRRQNFPRRNRVISGLSRGTLVVEAATGSGSLITARFAADQGREVFAIPGSVHNALSRGCHQLIREGAHLVETPAQVLAEISFRQENQLIM
jgi:DNA processing protein